ncbi:hypothetical protein B0H14DRAFT_2599831 [Mycena olivaceomarginata]|nr:hypothetical protein B0H14DRAFT_2599831 [Mycena olivaceomarginata]
MFLHMDGFVFFLWFLAPVLYFPNTWFGNFLLISSRTSILTANNAVDLDTYHAYSPLFISMMFAVSYGYNIFYLLSFASITESRSGFKHTDRFMNSPISMLVSCPDIFKFQNGGISFCSGRCSIDSSIRKALVVSPR